MAKSKKVLRMSVAEYLRREQNGSVKHEYLDGEVFAMTGGTAAHSLISTQILTSMSNQLRGHGCRVYGCDFKVRVDTINAFYYPDVWIDCGDYDKSRLYSETPAIIFEVLSPSTASTDRREKLFAYKCIPALRAYVIVHQSRRRLEIYQRDNDGDWTREEIGHGQECSIEVCSGTIIRILVDELYANTGIDDGPDLQVKEYEEPYVW